MTKENWEIPKDERLNRERIVKEAKEEVSLRLLAFDFHKAMAEKLVEKMGSNDQWAWSADDWTIEDIKECLIDHIEKGNPVDVANFAAFWWMRLEKEESKK